MSRRSATHRRPPLPDREQRLAALARACAAAGVPCTEQRRAVLEAVIAVTSHPTAGEVFARLERRRPKISRATVFRNLEGLVQMGVITKTCHPGRGVRYDGVVDRHHHLVCMRCNTVIDVADPKLDAITVPDVSAVGFEITDLRVQMRGLCQKCRKEKKS